MRPNILLFRLSLLAAFFLGPYFSFLQETASAGSGYEVVDLVNQVRSANGLASYKVNDALMAAAQGHSEYMAETGSVSHTGAGGSSPASRAASMGGGRNMSTSISPAGGPVVAGDSLHLSTLLPPPASTLPVLPPQAIPFTSPWLFGNTGSGSGSGSSPHLSRLEHRRSAARASPTSEVVIQVDVATAAADGSDPHC
jgi:hypothetical protein